MCSGHYQDSREDVWTALSNLESDLGNLDPAVHGEDLAAASGYAKDDLRIVREYLDGLVEQFEALRATVQKELDYMDGFPDVEDGSPLALVIESLRLALSNPATNPHFSQGSEYDGSGLCEPLSNQDTRPE